LTKRARFPVLQTSRLAAKIVTCNRTTPWNENPGIPEIDNNDDPDIYDLNVLSWDYPFSPLHLAIVGGHPEVIDVLVSVSEADILLSFQLVNR
jgi:hypothetical protein